MTVERNNKVLEGVRRYQQRDNQGPFVVSFAKCCDSADSMPLHRVGNTVAGMLAHDSKGNLCDEQACDYEMLVTLHTFGASRVFQLFSDPYRWLLVCFLCRSTFVSVSGVIPEI
ncbi:hypothetical protein HZ326_6171 [Fusarium oxysporum f. sp. albedinis]|nr:hypothetical protein HZ326_6171 [Fusarium oxysporum f. sp. albedinis]